MSGTPEFKQQLQFNAFLEVAQQGTWSKMRQSSILSWCYDFSTESYKLRQRQMKLLQLNPTQELLSNELIEEG